MSRNAQAVISMRSWDNREEQRYALARPLAGKLVARIGNDRLPVKAVKNVSSSGISLYLDVGAPATSALVIEYRGRNVKLDVSGTVAWCAAEPAATDGPLSPGRYLMGVMLLTPALLVAALNAA